jgi:hypothetical protein
MGPPALGLARPYLAKQSLAGIAQKRKETMYGLISKMITAEGKAD